MTLFAANGIAQTFDYQPGDISYVPTAYGHYVENTGNTTLRFLEIFNTDRYQDISLQQVRSSCRARHVPRSDLCVNSGSLSPRLTWSRLTWTSTTAP